ncbi:hypothetical protein GUJ93_ZPchr0013g35207 [Zizania palustris]|uniref:Uncharacterized protein n=1 Tax=Zizania palustris TaxID=103762 RepID=A0A8J5WSA5_ZIZPA|nr:hypothetical protein GUJ93_ZPchr0013g35207 [Zizania palustris]
MAHGDLSPSASNGIGAFSGSSAPYFIVYSCEPGTNHGSSSESLEFGSLGPVPTADGGDTPQATRQAMANGFGQRHVAFRGVSSHSSPDQPSSQPHSLESSKKGSKSYFAQCFFFDENQ